MRIGITYDLKVDRVGEDPDGQFPDDLQEEFDSPETIESIAMALRDLGHEVEMLGDGRELLERLLDDPPDFVFNLAEGQGVSRSREARVPAVLDMLGIPYTGSDPLTLAVTLDKDCAKRLVQAAGVAVPRGFIVEDREHEDRETRRNGDTETGTATAAVSDSSPCLRVSVSNSVRSSILNPQSSIVFSAYRQTGLGRIEQRDQAQLSGDSGRGIGFGDRSPATRPPPTGPGGGVH